MAAGSEQGSGGGGREAVAAFVGKVGVVLAAGMAVRIGVNGGAEQAGHPVGELVFGIGGDLVCGEQTQVGAHHDGGFGVPAVPDPTQSQPGDVTNADGRVMIFARNVRGGVSRQTNSNVTFGPWQDPGGSPVGTPAGTLDAGERATVFNVGATGLSATRQENPGLNEPFGEWEDLGM